MSNPTTWDPGYEEKAILDRLEIHARIYIGRSEGQRVAMEMHRAGLLSVTFGNGADHGLLICSKPVTGRYRPRGGGDVA